jgi:hypothetical protein
MRIAGRASSAGGSNRPASAALQKHADDFKQRAGFTYTVLDDKDLVVGCVYIPTTAGRRQCSCSRIRYGESTTVPSTRGFRPRGHGQRLAHAS